MNRQTQNVLIQIRPDYLDKLGGDSIQALRTREYLKKRGIDVFLSVNQKEDLTEYDVVHLFNVTRVDETFEYLKNALAQEKPVVFSPIYWNPAEYHARLASFLKRPQYTARIRALNDSSERLKELKKRIALALADILLPNSDAEKELLVRDFGLPRKDFMVVPNAVDPFFEHATREQFAEKHDLGDFVLCAARIEFRKNQLSLIKAVSDMGVPLVLIGDCFEPDYLEECKRAAGAHVVFMESLPQTELASAYKAAKVHALPSWFETPGLASLEAAIAGCTIVSTDRGSTKEYFGDMAWYCDPADIDSIRRAVHSALRAERKSDLKEHVRRNFTWEAAAEKTLQAYNFALEGKNRKQPSEAISGLMKYVTESETLREEFEQYAYELARFRNRLTLAPLRLLLRKLLLR